MSKLDDLTQLYVSNFRSIAGNQTIPLNAPIVLIHGPNGSGKTSILSALELALTGDIEAMRRDDQNFQQHLVHEGAKNASVSVVGPDFKVGDAGSFLINGGSLTGKSYLEGRDKSFFARRCYLAQSMLGRLLDIYQNAKADDGTSPLTQFVKELLGLDQLDALVEGLNDAGHKARTKNLVPEYRSLETRCDRSVEDEQRLTRERDGIDQARKGVIGELRLVLAKIWPNEPIDEANFASVGQRLRELQSEERHIAALRVLNELKSLNGAWAALPANAEAKERGRVEAEEANARARAEAWRGQVGAELEQLIAGLRATFPDLPSWSATDPTTAVDAAERSVTSELARLNDLLAKDATAEKRVAELNALIAKEVARGELVDQQLAGLAKDTGALAAALAGLLPHTHDDDCPVCGRNFGEVSKDPLAQHLQNTIARLTADAGRLTALSGEKTSATSRQTQLRRELAGVTAQRLSAESISIMRALQAGIAEAKVVLDRLAPLARQGKALLASAAVLRGRLASFRDRDRRATELRESLLELQTRVGPEVDGDARPFEQIYADLLQRTNAKAARMGAELENRKAAVLALQSIAAQDERRRLVVSQLTRVTADIKVMKAAMTELERLKGHAKTIADTAQDARTAIVRKVFNEDLNGLWRDLFVRLAPTEPFVPRFSVPEAGSKDFAKLETVHRSGKKGGTPGAMLSSGNLNTAALTLFLALHFSMSARLPWLILDDPIQNMDEVHIAQFAALLRTLSRAHGTKVVIAVHQRPLFDCLKLELSPAFEMDRLLTLELKRTAGEATRIAQDIVTYEPDAVAA